MEVMGVWQSYYNRSAYIDLGVGNGAQLEAQMQREAANRGWQFDRQHDPDSPSPGWSMGSRFPGHPTGPTGRHVL